MNWIKEKTVTTRKQHKCFGCLATFPAGATMRAQTIADDGGGIYTLYSCRHCDELMPYFDAGHEGYPEGFAADMKADENFEGNMAEFVEYVKATLKVI